MAFSPRRKLLAGVAVGAILIGVGVGIWHYEYQVAVPTFPIAQGDQISSWTFKGAYTGNATLIEQANADIDKLRTLLSARVCTEAEASSTMETQSTSCNAYDNYDIYIGIGNDYNLLGNGRAAYENYNRAVAVHPDKGLAYANLGHLFDELGAYATAANAYAKATAVEPGQIQYHIALVRFLTTRLPDDHERILAALTDASNQFGDTVAILSIEAQWLEDQGRYADAITAWQTVRMLSPANRQADIDAQIARDRAKQ